MQGHEQHVGWDINRVRLLKVSTADARREHVGREQAQGGIVALGASVQEATREQEML